MSRTSRFAIAIGTILTLSIDYAGLFVLGFVWNLDLFYFMLIILVLSLVFGAVVVDMTKAATYTSVALLFGLIISVGLLSFPSLSIGESETMMLVFSTVSKFFIMSLFSVIPGMIVGCFVGDALLNRSEFDSTRIANQ